MNNLTERDSRSTDDSVQSLKVDQIAQLMDIHVRTDSTFFWLGCFTVDPVNSNAHSAVCDHGRTWQCVKCQLIEWSKGV